MAKVWTAGHGARCGDGRRRRERAGEEMVVLRRRPCGRQWAASVSNTQNNVKEQRLSRGRRDETWRARLRATFLFADRLSPCLGSTHTHTHIHTRTHTRTYTHTYVHTHTHTHIHTSAQPLPIPCLFSPLPFATLLLLHPPITSAMSASWAPVPASEVAKRTINPIRDLVDQMDLTGNPEKKMIPLSIGPSRPFSLSLSFSVALCYSLCHSARFALHHFAFVLLGL